MVRDITQIGKFKLKNARELFDSLDVTIQAASRGKQMVVLNDYRNQTSPIEKRQAFIRNRSEEKAFSTLLGMILIFFTTDNIFIS
jgi:hypothetical protein